MIEISLAVTAWATAFTVGVYVLARSRIAGHERDAEHWRSMYQTALERACDLEIDPLGEQKDPIISIRYTKRWQGNPEDDAIEIKRAQGPSKLFTFDHGAQVWRHPETGREVFGQAAKRCAELHYAATRSRKPPLAWIDYPIT